ncbi:diacylglycerol kinase [Weissella diestrammenae]|uniref:Diacylglycerol kinase n=1 Tax=Weissella diestrammenae TaxID=1162633 RepID=A0A7G9T666_9LACO|nr:diacylglycerol kinase [Weissella diestrammenae]MCM0583369.1 diacylglycerol kinase [Weissella diestrammenae]QNN75591.1 diacylglycerol kinase [Weissella diestrammenae]
MTKRARIIYNPTSGREAIRRDLVDILAVYEKAGYETSAFATTAEAKSAENEARRASLAGFDLLIAAGGDGTINEVVNGIAPLTKRPKLAIIPAGTTNDYARALRIPRNEPLEAAKVVLQGQSALMDVGKANDTYFINIAAGGSLSELTYSVPSKLKTMYGYLAYVVKGAELITRVKPMNLHVKFDEGEYHGTASMFFLALTNSVGGFESIVPDAKLDDGKFTVLIVKTTKLPDIMALMTEIINGGRHVDDPNLIYVKASHVEVTSANDEQVMVNLDGEYGGDAPMVFDNFQKHLEIIANLDEMDDDILIGSPID